MSRDGSIRLEWGGRERTFRLGVAQWEKVQERCNAGPEEIAARLSLSAGAMRAGIGVANAAQRGLVGGWRIQDVREVIYQGLLGGEPELTSREATQLVVDLIDARPARQSLPEAAAIALAGLDGVPEEANGDKTAGEGEGAPAGAETPPESSGSAISTAGAPAPD